MYCRNGHLQQFSLFLDMFQILPGHIEKCKKNGGKWICLGSRALQRFQDYIYVLIVRLHDKSPLSPYGFNNNRENFDDEFRFLSPSHSKLAGKGVLIPFTDRQRLRRC